jgi:DNA-binding MarR family transcriptional regulator
MPEKLTPQQVYRIREIAREEPYVTQAMIGKHFGIAQAHVSAILNRKIWKTRG